MKALKFTNKEKHCKNPKTTKNKVVFDINYTIQNFSFNG